ncbi:MAG: hypothetical protein RL060_1555 [Bacteroidota bacterium]
MYKSFLISVFCFGCIMSSHAQNKKNIDPCQIFGSAYIENNRVDATYRIFIEESAAFANVIVYKQENALYADKAGHWFFTTARGFADFSVFIETNKAFADFVVHYTVTESFAGCNN